jgi:hypothetical protein
LQPIPDAKSTSQSKTLPLATGSGQSLPKVGQVLQDPKKVFADPVKEVTTVDALKSEAGPALKSGKESRKTKMDRVYQKSTPQTEVPDSLDEILKN